MGKPTRSPDVIFVPTPQEVVDKMLELAEVKKEDVVYDLGCGDGRIVVTAGSITPAIAMTMANPRESQPVITAGLRVSGRP